MTTEAPADRAGHSSPDALVDAIRARVKDGGRPERQAELQAKDAPKSDLDRTRGKLAMWRNMLDSISKGFSFELSTYVTVSAKGSKEYEASSLAQQKAKEMMSGIGSVFGVPPSIITGQDLLRFVEPEYLLPISTVTEQINKNIQEQVI